jgi:hypothetical protein
MELGRIILGYQFLMASFLTFDADEIVKIITDTKMRFFYFHPSRTAFKATSLLADAAGVIMTLSVTE